MKTVKRSTLHNKLDKITSLLIRLIGKCERCGNTNYELLQPSHIFSRSNFSVRWDFENILCLCAGCHFWWHKNPTLTLELVHRVIGKRRYMLMMMRAIGEIKKMKWSLQEYQNLFTNYSRLYEELKTLDSVAVATRLRHSVCADLAKNTN